MGSRNSVRQDRKWSPNAFLSMIRLSFSRKADKGLKKNPSVFIFAAVAVMILVITSLIVRYEKQQHERRVLERIYRQATVAGDQLDRRADTAGRQWVQDFLSQMVSVSPDILYVLLTDADGTILAADNDAVINRKTFPAVEISGLSHPVPMAAEGDVSGEKSRRVKVVKARAKQDFFLGAHLRVSAGDPVLEVNRDVGPLKTGPVKMRMGFSAQTAEPNLLPMAAGIMASGFAALALTYIMMARQMKQGLKPLTSFVDRVSDLDAVADTQQLRPGILDLKLDGDQPQTDEILKLNQAFGRLNERFALNWESLEHRHSSLEQIVENRTRALNHLNIRLVRMIEERKEIETRLLNVQKLEAISTLAGGIAHEFNNLFMGITGYASLIQRQSEPDSPNARKAEKIMELVGRGSESIKQLLGFARGGKYAPGPLNINEIIRINLEMFIRTRKDIEIERAFEPSIWSVHADRSQMEHIFMNLLINASEAMPSSGTITIETKNLVLKEEPVGFEKQISGRFVRIRFRDQGRGIDKTVIARIFDPFFTTKPMNTGTGLGLASVYGIVDNHGGFITVESEVNSGTIFNIFLPAAEKPGSETS